MKITTILTSIILSVFSLYAFSAEYQFRQKLEDTNFVSQYTPVDPKPPVVPTEPSDDYDISPYQNMAVTGHTGNESEYAYDSSFARAMNKDIVARQNNVFMITLGNGTASILLSSNDEGLAKNMKGLEIITSDNQKYSCKIAPRVSDITNIFCASFSPNFDNSKYTTGGPFSTVSYTVNFTK